MEYVKQQILSSWQPHALLCSAYPSVSQRIPAYTKCANVNSKFQNTSLYMRAMNLLVLAVAVRWFLSHSFKDLTPSDGTNRAYSIDTRPYQRDLATPSAFQGLKRVYFCSSYADPFKSGVNVNRALLAQLIIGATRVFST